MSYTSVTHNKYSVTIFKSKKGFYTQIQQYVKNFVRYLKKIDPDTVVMVDYDNNSNKIWIVGSKQELARMIDDQFKNEKRRANKKNN